MHQTRCRATLLILIAFTLLTPACRNAQTEKEATAPPPTSFVAPVPIVTELDSDMFPEFWLAPSINASATPVDEQHLDRGLAQIHKGMKKYPPDVLKANLERVYVVGELGFSGIFAGGTYSSDRVYQAVGSLHDGYTDQYIEGAFHHEFSSILLHNHGTHKMKMEWRSANPDGSSYGTDGTAAIINGEDSEAYDPKLAAVGFYSQYAMASYEEDFNTIACALLMGQNDLWDATKLFPPMKKKVDLMIQFYENLDPKFTRHFFESLRH